jgi:hypothetical protein
MQSLRRRLVVGALAALLATGSLVMATSRAATAETRSIFDDEYVFAATRAVSHMDASPAFKATLFPVTMVLDTACLPFAVVAGLVE